MEDLAEDAVALAAAAEAVAALAVAAVAARGVLEARAEGLADVAAGR